jgi:hypothetical protein
MEGRELNFPVGRIFMLPFTVYMYISVLKQNIFEWPIKILQPLI